ncbi:MAG TPA: adenylate/guanylate cyclase domain-containing protein [Acidimicrobiales bacterium]|nr:adenylate/guanylate cyclase domain-containing protein [Acidimicrobiales bacterium]
MRVERCFAFIDLTGFTAFTEHHGDERTVQILTRFRGRVREIAARRGVRVTKWLGDGAMLSSADTPAVVALVLEIADRAADTGPLDIRAGLAQGAVIMFEGDDYIGRAANVAARLCDAAAPAEVLATREVASLAPRWVAAGAPKSLNLQGIDRPVEAVVLSVATSEEMAVDPCCGLRLPVQRGLDTRFGADGTVQRFCSTACALAWEETQRTPPAHPEEAPARL